jgi:very-short-patch-repair endonuclease
MRGVCLRSFVAFAGSRCDLVVESDAWHTHGTRTAFEQDRAKDAALTATGHNVMRFTRRELRERPQTIVRRIRAAAARS